MKSPSHPPFKPLPWVAVSCKWNRSGFRAAFYTRWRVWIPLMPWLLGRLTVRASLTLTMASVCCLVKLSMSPCQVYPIFNFLGKSALTTQRPVRSSTVIKHQLGYWLLQVLAKCSCQGPDTEWLLAVWWLLSSGVWYKSHKWKGYFWYNFIPTFFSKVGDGRIWPTCSSLPTHVSLVTSQRPGIVQH